MSHDAPHLAAIIQRSMARLVLEHDRDVFTQIQVLLVDLRAIIGPKRLKQFVNQERELVVFLFELKACLHGSVRSRILNFRSLRRFPDTKHFMFRHSSVLLASTRQTYVHERDKIEREVTGVWCLALMLPKRPRRTKTKHDRKLRQSRTDHVAHRDLCLTHSPTCRPPPV